ncbi:MAG: lytic murein transglycosylase B [Gammaproteobacteria bacterium]|nr:lytic murein transglycosylase B [Gammaproteobacteria bacterium]MCP5136304.1 lytic murein transglycosylase B [Gammaproteobacteria bacterium]
MSHSLSRTLRSLAGIAAIALLALSLPALAGIGKVMDRPDARAFIAEMVSQQGFDAGQLEALFDKVELRQDIVDLMTRPAEGKPWKDYRKIFMTERRIEGGKKFCADNAHWLGRAEEVYGVPPEIITALIGVETHYGSIIGRHRVIDALSTLAFAYPPRARFFRSELAQFLILARDEGWDPLEPKGSYAGAMGWGQFIPSSYRSYTVDFDDDKHRDLWNSIPDIVGSIAYYLKKHGWRQGDLIAATARVQGSGYKELLQEGLKPATPFSALASHGVQPDIQARDDARLLFMEMDAENGPEYWLGFDNFYVITRYNHSHRYALVVTQLANAIRGSCLKLEQRDASFVD